MAYLSRARRPAAVTRTTKNSHSATLAPRQGRATLAGVRPLRHPGQVTPVAVEDKRQFRYGKRPRGLPRPRWIRLEQSRIRAISRNRRQRDGPRKRPSWHRNDKTVARATTKQDSDALLVEVRCQTPKGKEVTAVAMIDSGS